MLRRSFLAGGTVVGLGSLAGAGIATGANREAIIDSYAKDQSFQGVVLIGKAGKPDYHRTVGFAEIETGRAATLDTPYAIASISKWLTTMALLRLSEAGRIDIDAPITRFLPTYRADTGAKVSLKRLLSNTSGIPNGYLPALKADPSIATQPISAAEAVTRYCSGDLTFEPGKAFDYAFSNWIILVAIIEAVTGKPYPTVMAELVTDPLGLKHTSPATPDGLAASYRSVSPLQRHTAEQRPYYLTASGGFISTAGDLFAAAHRAFDGNFLAPASKRELLKVQWAEQDYALGGRVKMLFTDGMPRVFAWETGRTEGYRSVLAHRFDDQTTLVLLNNTSVSQKAMDEFAFKLLGAG
jgi:Beta-lactamase class C and other penicillin binding proteins